MTQMLSMLRSRQPLGCNWLGLVLAIGVILPVAAASENESSMPNWDCGASENGQWLCTKRQRQGDTQRHRPAERTHIPANNPEEPRVGAGLNLDWVDKSDMIGEQKRLVSSNCCGGYIQPERDYPDADMNPDDASLRINANSTEAITESAALLEGDVQFSQGYRQARSDSAEIQQGKRLIKMEGNVQFREPGLLMLGDSVTIQTDSKEIEIDNPTYLIHAGSAHGTADSLSRTKDGIIALNRASFSTCRPGDSIWRLVSGKLSINQDSGYATMKNVRMEVKDVPIFYFPYLKFPVTDRRASGLLFPSLSVHGDNGIDYEQPIYWNIASNYDATITPRYIQKRGVALEIQGRHLSAWSMTEIAASYLGNDKGGKSTTKKDAVTGEIVSSIDNITGLRLNEGEGRYRGSIKHNGGIDRPWSTGLDYSKVSDFEYFDDLGDFSVDDTSPTHLAQRASVGYKTQNWNYGIDTLDHQLITQGLNGQYEILPRFTADGYYRFDNNLTLKLDHEYSVFDRDDDPSYVTGSRSRLDYSLSWPNEWAWGYITPKISFKHRAYDLDLNNSAFTDDSPSVSVPVYSIDGGLFLERDTNWLGELTQTLEPRLYYVNVALKDQSALPDFDTSEMTAAYDRLFADNRFGGGDRIADEQRLTVALTSRFISKKTGQERLKISLAQSFYYADRLVKLPGSPAELSQSPIALDFTARFNANWRITGDVVYDRDKSIVEKASIGVRYNDGKNRLLNLTHRYTRDDPRLFEQRSFTTNIEQANISAMVPLVSNVNLVARWNRDFTNQRDIEIFAGLEYNSCCWRATLVWRRWIDREDSMLFPERDLLSQDGIMLQVQFKGLASSSGRVDTILEKGIYGYEPPVNF
mgnify:CR=1 FL=1